MDSYWNPVVRGPKRGALQRLVAVVEAIGAGTLAVSVVGSLWGVYAQSPSTAVLYAAPLVGVVGAWMVINRLNRRIARLAVRIVCFCGFGLFALLAAAILSVVVWLVLTPGAHL